MMRIVFIQLPLLNHTHDYIIGNIEYASASIAGYIKRHVDSDCEIYPLPFVLSNFGSNRAISTYVLAIKPDIVAFTCYLWNIERNLMIAALIKKKDPRVLIVMGGVEINNGSVALATKQESVDYFVTGEGEWFFHAFMSGENMENNIIQERGNTIITQPPEALISAESIFEPLTGNRLQPMPDGSIFFELTRGCHYSCSYCLYSKNYKTVRELSFDALCHVVEDMAIQRHISEIYILSPAFNCAGNFRNRLERLADRNHGVRLHSEMRAEGIDEATARLLYRAGFRSMEVGLQTMTVNALHRAGRATDTEKELAGMEHLKKAGIDIKIGIIPGLPGETRDTFFRTVDRLARLGFAENIELYPLMILPGTVMRDRAERDSIAFSSKPPYYYHGGWGISFDDIREITAMTEELTGYSHVVKRLPDFTSDDDGSFCRGIRFNGDDECAWDLNRYEHNRDTAVFSLFITVSNGKAAERGLMKMISTLAPGDLLNIIMHTDAEINEKKILDYCSDRNEDSLMQRMYIFHDWKDGLGIRLYQVFNDYNCYILARRRYSWILPILKISGSNYIVLERIHSSDDNVLIAKGALHFVRNSVRKYFEAVDSIAFEDAMDQKEFYRIIGQDYVRFPYTFIVKN